MPNDKISIAPANYGGKPGGDPFGDIDESASFQQVPNVYKPNAKNDVLAGKDIDEGHGGIPQPEPEPIFSESEKERAIAKEACTHVLLRKFSYRCRADAEKDAAKFISMKCAG